MTFQLKSILLFFAFLALIIALVMSRLEVSRLKQHHTVNTGLVDGIVGISMLNNNNFMALVGNKCELRFRCFTQDRRLGKREVIEEFRLGPGRYTVCLINDKISSLFGCCVNDQLHVHPVPKDLDTNWMGFGAATPPDWREIWNVGKLGGDQIWGIELQKKDSQKIIIVDEFGRRHVDVAK